MVRASFKPEFLNRLDDLVVFSALAKDELARIAELQIDRLAQRLAERRLTLEVTPEALAWLADEGNDPAYGARPLRRLVQTAIGDRLAKEILSGEVQGRRHGPGGPRSGRRPDRGPDRATTLSTPRTSVRRDPVAEGCRARRACHGAGRMGEDGGIRTKGNPR